MKRNKLTLLPVKLLDISSVLALTLSNMLYCLLQIFIVLFIGFFAMDLLEPFVADPNVRNDIAVWIATWLPLMILSTLTGVLISKLRIWLLSLPVQFGLYWTATYFAPVVFAYDSVSTVSAVTCAQFAGRLLLIQIPGVAIGLLIRKVKARKQQRATI